MSESSDKMLELLQQISVLKELDQTDRVHELAESSPCRQRLSRLNRVQLDCHPDAIRVGVIPVPRIAESTVIPDCEERVVSVPWRHRHVFVERLSVVLPKFLHMACAKDLGVDFQKLVSGMDSAIRLFWCVPQIQLEPVASRRR